MVSWNIGINDHNPAVNITAERSSVPSRFVPCREIDAEELLERSRVAAERCGLEFSVTWRGLPLHADPRSPFVREALALTGGAFREPSRTARTA